MKKLLQYTLLLLTVICCKQPKSNMAAPIANAPINTSAKFYSKAVKDTFTISVQLPNHYNNTIKYPVVYLLDGNLYFDIIAAAFKSYSEAGLLSPAIVVGIGYKNLMVMDSLRCRDFTYPVAIPEYEMAVSGRADKFLSFINNELVPHIDAQYATDTNNRVLAGHSLGGYFALYALHQNLLNNNSTFSSYIAASPSTHYNHNYILKQLEMLTATHRASLKAYVTFGGLEDEEDNDPLMLKSEAVLGALSVSLKQKNNINYKGETFSNLGHTDTPLPTFIKGLQWMLNKE